MRIVATALAGALLSVAVGGCGASTNSPSASGASAVTVDAQSVTGVGTVLVANDGRTLYILSSEKGGKVTCISANGCTTAWPPLQLPAGVSAATAGAGVTASLLGTATDPNGSVRVTYAGYPLYTFSGDGATGTSNGEGIASFGGTWTAITPAGSPATKTGASSAGGGHY